MPYLSIHTNVELLDTDKQEALLAKASKTVASMLGKPESYVMIEVQAGQAMSFAGSREPLAYLQLKSLGLPETSTTDFSAILCGLIEAELGIDPGRIYIEFTGPDRHMWGWDNRTF